MYVNIEICMNPTHYETLHSPNCGGRELGDKLGPHFSLRPISHIEYSKTVCFDAGEFCFVFGKFGNKRTYCGYNETYFLELVFVTQYREYFGLKFSWTLLFFVTIKEHSKINIKFQSNGLSFPYLFNLVLKVFRLEHSRTLSTILKKIINSLFNLIICLRFQKVIFIKHFCFNYKGQAGGFFKGPFNPRLFSEE